MMGKKFKNGYIIITDDSISRIDAIRNGFKEVVERPLPSDYSPELYKIIYEDIGQWIILTYERL